MAIDVSTANRTGVPQVLYTDDPNNALVVSLTTGAAVPVTAGPVVTQHDAGQAATTLLYIAAAPSPHGRLLTDPQTSALHVTCDGWAAEYLDGFWSLAPTTDGTLSELHVTLENWPLLQTATSGQLYVEYHRFGGESGWKRPVVFVHAAPAATPKPLQAHLAFGVPPSGHSLTDHVDVWDERPQDDVKEAKENTVVLRLVNDEPSAIASAAAGAPRTSLRFMFASAEDPSPDILTTIDLATRLQWAVPAGWEDPQLDTQAGLPCWTLTPPAGDTFLGATARSSGGPDASGDHAVTFTLSGLVVRRPTGVVPVYLQHVNVPNHDDGFVSLDIPKVEPPAGIVGFESALEAAPPKGGEVYLTWTTYDVDAVHLSYPYGNAIRTLSTPDLPFRAGRFLVPDRIDDLTTYTLTAMVGNANSGPPKTVTLAPYATDVEVVDVELTPALPFGPDDTRTLTFRVAKAASVVVRVDGGSGTVGLTAGADGHVSCALSTPGSKTLVVKQGTVTRGTITLARPTGPSPPGTTRVVLRIEAVGTERGHVVQATAELIVCVPAPAMRADLALIRTAGADGAVEIDLVSGASRYQTRPQPPYSTTLQRTDGANGIWTINADNPYTEHPSLLFIKTRDLDSGSIEVYWRTLESSFQDGHFYESDLDESAGPLGAWSIGLPLPGLALIATAYPSTDATVWVQARTDDGGFFYHPWGKPGLPTCYARALGPKGVWLLADMIPKDRQPFSWLLPELVFIQTTGTASGCVELSYATGESHFLTAGPRFVTGFVPRDPASGRWQLADMNGDGTLDLVLIKTSNTNSARVEVFYATAASGYKSITGGYTAFSVADGPSGTWQVVPAGLLTPDPASS